jgi:DUF4097 and DUF4098 domain-containing protein YvlB
MNTDNQRTLLSVFIRVHLWLKMLLGGVPASGFWKRGSSVAVLLALLPLGGASQEPLEKEPGGWALTYRGSAAATRTLRINGHGPVTLEGGAAPNFVYTVRLSVAAASEAEARSLLARVPLAVRRGQIVILTAPGGAVRARIEVKAPALSLARIVDSDGAISATGIEGELLVESRIGDVTVDRIGGPCTVTTGGGDVRVGEVHGRLRCVTGGGKITLQAARGEAMLETYGGDIVVEDAGGGLRAQTAAGSIRVHRAGGPVTAITGGGEVAIEKAGGTVTVRNLAGPVQLGAAQGGFECQSASGGIRLSGVTGPMRVSTSLGSIVADLTGAHLGDSFLATTGGDITVLIPSNLGVTIHAENRMADTPRRIVSDFAAIPVMRVGSRVVAHGAANGGGPLLRISGAGGTIFIKRQ